MGIVVALGLIVMIARLPWRYKLWITSHPLAVDVSVFALLNLLHWGSYTGLMVAASSALFCSLVLSFSRRVIGFVDKGRYIRGFMDVSTRIKP